MKFEIGKNYWYEFASSSNKYTAKCVKRTDKSVWMECFGKVTRHLIKNWTESCESIGFKSTLIVASDLI